MSPIWTPEFTHEDFEIVARQPLLSGYLKIERLKIRFKLFGGGWSPAIEREVLQREAASAVLLYHPPSDQVVMVEQIRMGVLANEASPWILEPVAGVIDPEETSENAAHREAFEEAGCAIVRLIPVNTYIVSPGISTEITFAFCGLLDRLPDHHSLHGLVQEGEDIRLHVLPSETAFALLRPENPMSAASVILLRWLQGFKHSLTEFCT